ncbi:hypothetical protein EJ03DRAFT_328503 [Teratosphaeria nubilosa]|uniref:Uncharacterized protein n=1 Tax=Teratosphaeria nubilosa TaxID=161662 RepID=A0A6G1L5I1_9PEZI|nr:hypothetical protein EJ03DRAFT_328503 [Teratosphaeria nubilosa]
MAAPLRDTASLIKRIDALRGDFLARFQNLIAIPNVGAKDRNTSAIIQLQMQVETAALIKAGEDMQTLIRQLQEMWLFGQLKPAGESEAQKQADASAENVAGLLQQLSGGSHRTAINGHAE